MAGECYFAVPIPSIVIGFPLELFWRITVHPFDAKPVWGEIYCTHAAVCVLRRAQSSQFFVVVIKEEPSSPIAL
jgi:hypothetical protein